MVNPTTASEPTPAEPVRLRPARHIPLDPDDEQTATRLLAELLALSITGQAGR